MFARAKDLIFEWAAGLVAWVRPNVTSFWRTREPAVWAVSLGIGAAVSVAAVLFRELVDLVQNAWLAGSTGSMASAAARTPWYVVLLVPALGGLLIGWLLNTFLPARRTGGIADVIEARAMGGRNIEMKPGMISALVSALSLGFGASAGREGPMVHLGATIATSLSERFSLPDWARRTLLACGAAAAISASFNAPITGVLFAHEVVLQHYAKRSFIPIVISSVMGTILSRNWFGDAAAFSIPAHQITSYLEFPAFALLGLICAVVAMTFQASLVLTDRVARAVPMPLWLRPAVGGFLIGSIAIVFPQVLGVGYEATDNALQNALPLGLLLALIVAKTAATAITLGSRFGGGIVSPSLYIGAMTGGAFGLIAASVFPALASSQGLYAILGMGAVAAAVIGAPISTAVMVFELTGGYALSIALLLTVGIAVGINQAVLGRSYFHWQLEGRGQLVMDGPHRHVARTTRVAAFMRPLAEGDDPARKEDETLLRVDTTLEAALRAFDEGGYSEMRVCTANDDSTCIGKATQVEALRIYNKALVDMSVEEHR